MQQFEFKLGERVLDQVTGFQGTITGRVEFLSGVRRYLLTSNLKDDGGLPETAWFDEERLDRDPDRAPITLRLARAPVGVEP